jgi:hypothetical protein
MKYVLIGSLVFGLLLGGCGKGPSDEKKVEEEFINNEFYKALDKTPRDRPPSQQKVSMGDTSHPCDIYRKTGKAETTFDINVTPPTADIPIEIKWSDTLITIYSDAPDNPNIKDTVIKPSPYFKGNLTFYYKHENDEWKLEKLTPVKVRSDSALSYVKIDSVQLTIIRGGQTISLNTITNPSTPIVVEDYHYTFKTGDSVRVRVYESSRVISRWVFLHAPTKDNVSWFTYNPSGGYWEGTWQVNTSGTNWGWVHVADMDVFLKKYDVMAARAELWGLPYKVK